MSLFSKYKETYHRLLLTIPRNTEWNSEMWRWASGNSYRPEVIETYERLVPFKNRFDEVNTLLGCYIVGPENVTEEKFFSVVKDTRELNSFLDECALAISCKEENE